jgi:hypothetical protein
MRSGLVAVAMLGATMSTAWAEACVNGICANSVSNGKYVSVRYRVQNGPVSHVNIRSTNFEVRNCEGVCPDINQREGPPSGAFELLRSKNGPTRYAIQACVRGGFLQRSSCGRWANFRHGN